MVTTYKYDAHIEINYVTCRLKKHYEKFIQACHALKYENNKENKKYKVIYTTFNG